MRAIGKAIAIGVLFALSCVWAVKSHAHSWYEWECCSAQDCWPMGEDADAKEPEPKIVPGGYLTHDGIFIAEKNTRPSRDGRFHVCRYGGSKTAGVISPTNRQICLYAPQPTF